MSQSLGPVRVLSPVPSGSEVSETESPDVREPVSAPDPVRVQSGFGTGPLRVRMLAALWTSLPLSSVTTLESPG